MGRLRLDILGGFRLSAGNRALRRPSAKKARALLAYLVFQEGRPVSRHHLAALLWSFSDDQRARHSLSEALSSIRRVFDGTGVDCLELGRDTVRLDPAAMEVDAHRFAVLAARRDAASLERAAALYRGDLLRGLAIREPEFEAWLHSERARVRGLAVNAMTALLDVQVQLGRFDDAIRTAHRTLYLDPLDERACRALMRLYAQQGHANAALRQFRALERLLDQELSARPEIETLSLFQTIARRKTGAPAKRKSGSDEPPDADERPAIAVLPFADHSEDRDPDLLADGLTDDLINDLSRIGGVRVIARNTSYMYKNRTVRVRDVAAALGVRYVVEGSVQRLGGRVRVNVQFVDGRTEHRVWSDRFDRTIETVFSLQDEITGRIANELRLELLRSESRRARLGPPADLSAWSYATRAWSELWTKPASAESVREAKRLAERALERDPSSSFAWTAMARVRFVAALYPYLYGFGERLDSYGPALEAAETAVALDPKSAEAFAELGAILLIHSRYDEALAACHTAIDLNPNYEEAHSSLAMINKDRGEPAEALRIFRHSLRLAPHLPTDGRRAYFIAWTHLLAGQHEQALAYANRSLVANAKFAGPYWIRACVYGWQGRRDLAETALAELVRWDDGRGTIDKFARQYRHVANNEHAIEGLLRAGMPEK